MTVSPPWANALAVAGPFVLVAGSAWPAPLLPLFTLTLTGDRLLGLLALAALAILGLRGGVRWTAVHTALALFVTAQVVTTALNAGAWRQGPKFVTIYVLGFACFALAAEWTRDADGQRRMVWAWLAVGAVVGALGTVTANLSNVVQRPLWGAGVAQVLRPGPDGRLLLFGPKVTFPEWNLFSSFLLVSFTLGLWLWRRDGGPRRGHATALAAVVFGLVNGVTRAAWLSMPPLAALWTWTTRPGRRRLAVLGAMIVAALLVQGLSLGAPPVGARLSQTSTVTTRFVINRATVDSWRERPLVGHGAGSVNRLGVPRSAGRPMEVWTGNIVLFVLHDSGALGLAALLALAAVVARRGWRARRHAELAVPLLACGAALAFAYQFTHALWLMYPYVYLGLLTSVTEPPRRNA